MAKFFFTFGMNHVNKDGISLGNNYVVIEAPNEGVAREMMHNARGPKWSFSYDEDRFGNQAEQWNLKPLSLSDVRLTV